MRGAAGGEVLGGIPDKFEEAIIFGLIVPFEGFLVDLTADADDVAAHDGRSIGHGSWRKVSVVDVGGVGIVGSVVSRGSAKRAGSGSRLI